MASRLEIGGLSVGGDESTSACNSCHVRAKEACFKHFDDYMSDGNYAAACDVIELMRALGLI